MTAILDQCHETAEAKLVAWDELANTFRAKSDLLKAAREKITKEYKELQKKRENLAQENGGEDVADEDMIKINAGGELVMATRGTLTHLKGTLLEALFSGRWEKKLLRDDEGRVFLDVNPVCFRSIVDHINELKISAPGSLVNAPSVNDDNEIFMKRLMFSLGLSPEGKGDTEISLPKNNDASSAPKKQPTPAAGGFSFGASGTGGFGSPATGGGATGVFGAPTPTVTPFFGSPAPAPGGFGGTKGLCPSSSTRNPHRERLIKFYEKHNPSKLDSVDKTLARYKGREDYLFNTLEEKYCPSLTLAPGIFLPEGAGGNEGKMDTASFSMKDDERSAPAKQATQRFFLEQWQALSFDEFPEKLRAAFEREQASLIGAKEDLAVQNAFLEKEMSAVNQFSSGETADIIYLNVSGVKILTKRSTLGVCKDSVLAKQFDDPKWAQKDDASKTLSTVEEWSCDQVTAWIKEIKGIPKETAETIQAEQITGTEILAMKREDFKDIGIKRAGTLALLTTAVEDLKNQQKKSHEVFIEQSPYCLQKIIDHLRLAAMRQPDEPLPPKPYIRAQERERFRKVVDFYFPGESASFLLVGSFDSNILSRTHEVEIQNWLEEEDSSGQLNLLYRASRDGWGANNFHSCCDNKGATVTVIRSSGNCIFGGFADVSWTSTGGWNTSPKAFLFALKGIDGIGPRKFPQISAGQYHVVHHDPNRGPAFGCFSESKHRTNVFRSVAYDLAIANCSNSTSAYNFCCFGASDGFEKYGRITEGENNKFQAAEVEVFSIN